MTTEALALDRSSDRSDGVNIPLWLAVGVLAGLGLSYGLAAMHGLALTTGTTTSTPATSVGVAALCYLAAAATHTRWVSWLGVPVFSGLAFAGLAFAGLAFAGLVVSPPWWTLFVLAAVVLLLVGLLAGTGLVSSVQGSALLGFFGVAVVALQLEPRVGLALAGLALAAHALWDVWHYQHDAVVSRSMAVFCIGLDVTVGGLCVVLALLG